MTLSTESVEERLKELSEETMAIIEGCLPQLEDGKIPDSVKRDLETLERLYKEMDNLIFFSPNYVPPQQIIDLFSHISKVFKQAKEKARLVS